MHSGLRRVPAVRSTLPHLSIGARWIHKGRAIGAHRRTLRPYLDPDFRATHLPAPCPL